jgi:hypothetical protein
MNIIDKAARAMMRFEGLVNGKPRPGDHYKGVTAYDIISEYARNETEWVNLMRAVVDRANELRGMTLGQSMQRHRERRKVA